MRLLWFSLWIGPFESAQTHSSPERWPIHVCLFIFSNLLKWKPRWLTSCFYLQLLATRSPHNRNAILSICGPAALLKGGLAQDLFLPFKKCNGLGCVIVQKLIENEQKITPSFNVPSSLPLPHSSSPAQSADSPPRRWLSAGASHTGLLTNKLEQWKCCSAKSGCFFSHPFWIILWRYTWCSGFSWTAGC